MKEFKAPINTKGKPLPKNKWNKEQTRKSEAIENVTKLSLNILFNNILCKIDTYQYVKKLYSKMV